MKRDGCDYRFINVIVAAIAAMAFFVLCSGIGEASIASSKNYKLYTSANDGGGARGASTNYTAENSVGFPLGTKPATGTKYKIYAGVLSTTNSIPDVDITSFNDGQITLDDTPTLTWSYEDKDADPQRYYQIQISKDDFKTFVVDSGLISSSEKKYTTPILPTEEQAITYKWRVRVSDGFDYSGWKVAQYGFRLSTSALEAPIIWAKDPSTGKNIPAKLWQRCSVPYLYWEYPVTGAEIAGYSYAWGDLPDDEIDTTGTSYQTEEGFLSDGVRVFNLKAQTSSGKWTDVASFEVWLDRGAPALSYYSPSDGALVSSDTPTISVKALDDKSGVDPDSIVMKINRSTVKAGYEETGQNIVYIPSTPLSEGENVIEVEVSDIVGNTTTPLVWSFTVDTAPPEGSIIINNQDPMTNSVYVNLTIDAADSTTGVKSMSISNDGVFDTEPWEAFSTRKDNWVLPAISGTRKVYIRFMDEAGNVSEPFSDTIELVIIAPDTIITSSPPPVTTLTDALFTFKATMTGCVFRWKFDDEEWSEWSGDTAVKRQGLEEGNHYFKVQAAKDVNGDGTIGPDEIDPVPAERTWSVKSESSVKPGPRRKRPFRFWKEE